MYSIVWMAILRILCWALIFLTRLRFPPGKPVAHILVCFVFQFPMLFVSLLVISDGLPLQGKRCDWSNAKKRNNVKYYRKSFLFLKKFKPKFGVSLPQLGSRVNTQNAGTTKCPWYWKEHVDPSRKPRTLAVAECKTCSPTNCRQFKYTQQVLVEECDQATGEKVWVWKQQTFPIGFVYIAWNLQPFDFSFR